VNWPGALKTEARSSVTREIGWPMGHRLQHHDGACRLAHGHNYLARVTIECRHLDTRRAGRPDDGMVVDFTALDASMRAVITPWDHAFMLQRGDPLAAALDAHARLVIVEYPPTAENIAWMILQELQRMLARQPGSGLFVRRVEVHEGPKSVATAEETDV
jgi:6-pyruvoyl tetrahydropterin synthase/QueD family protein